MRGQNLRRIRSAQSDRSHPSPPLAPAPTTSPSVFRRDTNTHTATDTQRFFDLIRWNDAAADGASGHAGLGTRYVAVVSPRQLDAADVELAFLHGDPNWHHGLCWHQCSRPARTA